MKMIHLIAHIRITSKAVTWKIRFVLMINTALNHNYVKSSINLYFFMNWDAISECQWPYYNVVRIFFQSTYSFKMSFPDLNWCHSCQTATKRLRISAKNLPRHNSKFCKWMWSVCKVFFAKFTSFSPFILVLWLFH